MAVGSNGTILRTEDGGETWKRVDKNLREWLYAVAFADEKRGYAVGARGIILRTDDGGDNWKDVESGFNSNLFAVAVAGRDDVLVTGEQGRIIHSADGGATWEMQPTITSSPLYSVAYRGGYNLWVAGRGGAILRRTDPLATVSIPTPKLPPGLTRRTKTSERPESDRRWRHPTRRTSGQKTRTAQLTTPNSTRTQNYGDLERHRCPRLERHCR